MYYRIRTKACKRCGGDLSLERDKYGTYISCIQCGAFWSESDLMPSVTRTQNNRQPEFAAKVVSHSLQQ